MKTVIEKPHDHDFIQTFEDFLFCVIGYSHPKNRVISYLKYIPNPEGKWKLGSTSLKRVLNHYSALQVLNSYQFLNGASKKYLFDCPVSKIKLIAVPHNQIKKYFKPQDKVQELYFLFQSKKTDRLQTKTVEFINLLATSSKIHNSNFGVTGSILTNTQNPIFSDMDLTIHGRKNSQLIEKILNDFFERENSEITRLKPKIAKEWRLNKIKTFNFDEKQAQILFKRKWNMGYFKDTRFSIHPIRTDKEILEKYGDFEYIPKNIVEIEGTIINDGDSIYLPCKYDVSDVKVQKGEKVRDMKQIISYEGLFCFIVKKDEHFRARGKLERVIDKKNKTTYHRLLIGSYLAKSRDFLLPIQ
ncbi:MAG: nucleotidyltransferase domain-containing protein [Candidatus Helarchaeota archaeon]